MISQKLWELLTSFSVYEMNRLRKFILSPYFNEQENLIRLFDIIDDNLRQNDGSIAKEVIWQQLFPEKGYNDIKMRRLFSDLGQIARRFLAIQSFESDPASPFIYLLKACNERKLNKQFTSLEKKTRSALIGQFSNDEFYLKQFQLENELDQFKVKQLSRTKTRNLVATDHNLDLFYLVRKLKHYCDALNYKNVLNVEVPIGLINSLIGEIEAEGLLQYPAIGIYYKIMMTLLEPEAEHHFFDLKRLLNEHPEIFPQPELIECYIFAQNYCIKKINAGKSHFSEVLFEVYKELIEQEVIFDEGKLAPWHYKNIITLGLRLKAYDWTERFINENQPRLPEDRRKNALAYNTAMLHFHKHEYPKVIEALSQLEYNDVYYAVDGRWLLLKTYYELSEFEALDSLLESFRLFLLRQKLISGANKRKYLNLVRYVQKLSKVNISDKTKINALKARIDSAKDIAEKDWLQEKVAELVG
ncbi:MAG: hypothetical protein AAF502_03865 [Bacteroidota bacterium]